MAKESAPPGRQAPSMFDAPSADVRSGETRARGADWPNVDLPPARPLSRVATAVALAALIVIAVAYGTRTPDPASASAPATAFSAQRAMRHVRAMAERPHPTGSQDNARVREYLMTELRAMSLAPEIQDVTGIATRYAASGRVRNVVVRIPGTQPGGAAVLVMAHYDGVPAGPAASDDAAGSSALLEAIRALRAGSPLTHDVIGLFTDAEEDGLIGAAAFVREHRWIKDVAVVLNFEARGSSGPSYMFETGPGNLGVVRVLRGVSGVRATSLTTAVYRQLPNDTDLSEIALLGLQAMNFAFIGRVDHYHTTQDDASHLDGGSLQHHGNQVLALTRAFANGPLPLTRTSDAVFFDFPGIGLVVYGERWAVPLAIVAVLCVAVALVRLRRRREPRWVLGVSLGALGTVVAAGLSGLCAIGFGIAVGRVHASLGGTPEFSTTYLIAAAFVVVAITTACYAVVRRWAGANAVFLGALVVWAWLAVVVAIYAPGVSFLFAWPLLGALPAAFAASGSEVGGSHTANWAAALVVAFLVVPTIYGITGLALGLVGPGAVTLGVLGALGLCALAPHLEVLAGARPWSTPVYSAAGAVLLCAFGAATVRTSEARPVGASLVYAVDADGTAWLSGYGWGAPGRNWVRDAVASVHGDASATAPAWAFFGSARGAVARAPSPLSALDAPTTTIVSDSTAGSTRRVTLRVRAPSGTLNVLLGADSGTVIASAVDGRSVDTKRYRRQSGRWQLQYVAPSDSGFLLTLDVPAGSHPKIDVSARWSGMSALRGVPLPPRPAGVIPAQTGDMTVVHRRVTL